MSNKQGVRLRHVRHIENGQKGIKIKAGEHRETDYTDVGLLRFYCIFSVHFH